jgi:hypothetical protein
VGRVLRQYSAAVFFVGMALSFNVLHFYMEVVVSPDSGTVGYWLNTTAENLQSEMWQVAAAAWAFKHFRWKGSPESKEVD